MGITNFDTITLGGLANLSGPELSGIKAAVLRGGTIYYVDANVAASGNGLSWATAFLTMAEAFAVLASGDTIIFRGKIKERLVTPVQVFDVTIIGAGNRPRHADSTPDGGQEAANTWTFPTLHVSTDPLLKIIQQGWRLENILFSGLHDGSSVLLYRDAGASDAERDASHTEIVNCRFAAGLNGVEIVECYNVRIAGCRFHDQTGYAIKYSAGAGQAAPYRNVIEDNDFDGCANWIGVVAAHYFIIRNNVIAEITTLHLDTRTGSGHNVIVNNAFDINAAAFDDTAGVYGHATDTWSNILLDTIETGVPA